MNVFLDIETIPAQPEENFKLEIAANISAPAQMKKAETIAEWHAGAGKYVGIKETAIEDAYRKTSFDGSKGEIISIAWAAGASDIKCSYRKLGESEAQMIIKFFDLIVPELEGRPPYFIGHYISGFDLKFLFHRCVILGINPPFNLLPFGRHSSDLFDTMTAWAGYRDKIKQDALCKALGIEGKPDGIDGSKVWDFVKAGKENEVAEYNKDDVEKVRLIYNRLSFNEVAA